MILPIFILSHSNNHYPSSSVEYKETRVISEYRDEVLLQIEEWHFVVD